jgi:antitoxin (DNA-binding transcriptional repressor) of toxin-antitoxin stability system
MPACSVAATKHKLSTLIELAWAGGDVIVTWQGRPVVRLDPVAPAPCPLTGVTCLAVVAGATGPATAEGVS